MEIFVTFKVEFALAAESLLFCEYITYHKSFVSDDLIRVIPAHCVTMVTRHRRGEMKFDDAELFIFSHFVCEKISINEAFLCTGSSWGFVISGSDYKCVAYHVITLSESCAARENKDVNNNRLYLSQRHSILLA